MTEEITTQNEEKCPRCEMDRLLVAIPMAHIACGAIKDEEERGECMGWASGIDPTKITSYKEILRESYKRTGMDGLAKFPEIHHKIVSQLIIEMIGEKIANGETPTKEELDLYNKYTKEEEEKGI